MHSGNRHVANGRADALSAIAGMLLALMLPMTPRRNPDMIPPVEIGPGQPGPTGGRSPIGQLNLQFWSDFTSDDTRRQPACLMDHLVVCH